MSDHGFTVSGGGTNEWEWVLSCPCGYEAAGFASPHEAEAAGREHATQHDGEETP